MSDNQARAQSTQPATSDGRLLTIPLSVFSRAYLLSRRERLTANIVTLLWIVTLVAAAECAGLKFLSIASALKIAIAVTVLRFAAIKIYLVLIRAPMSDMPLRARLRASYLALRGRAESAARTASIVTGLCLIVTAVLLIVDPNLFRIIGPSWNAPILIGLLVLFVAAVLADVLVHRWYARNAKDGNPTNHMW